MREKNIQNSRFIAFLFTWCLMIIVFFCMTGITVQAKVEGSAFSIDANLLPSDGDTYNIQLSVENAGADWEGTVRLMVGEQSRISTAYDVVLSLPQGSVKQFVMNVPKNSTLDTDGTIRVSLWDEKSEKITDKEFKHFLMNGMDTLTMGILSDEYSSLTYLDLGGEELYFWKDSYPIKLVELNQTNLLDNLDALQFLVIDTYNTEVLTDEEVEAIELWNYAGGLLLVGTGSHGEETLKGLGDRMLSVECGDIHAPGEVDQYYYYGDMVDLTKLHIAEVKDMHGYYDTQYLSSAMVCSVGDGAVGIFPYALTELGKVGEDFYQEYYDKQSFLVNMLDEICAMANSRYNNYANGQSYDIAYRVERMLRTIGNTNSSLNFSILKFIVIAYVIFVGPVLYLILRMVKKREFYWVAVPIATLIGVVLIFFAGRGFEVVNTKVYSVTCENLADSSVGKTYLYAYDASHDEWNLRMQRGYEYAGTSEDYNYYYSDVEDDYNYHIIKEGDRLFLGFKPSQNFEDTFFVAGKSGGKVADLGNVTGRNIVTDFGKVLGTVTNETNYDFSYYAVIVNDALFVYENLPSGEMRDMEQQDILYKSTGGHNLFNDYQYNFIQIMYGEEEPEKISSLSALGVAVYSAYAEAGMDKTVIIGVTEDAEKTVDDDCSEIAYRCFYVIQ